MAALASDTEDAGAQTVDNVQNLSIQDVVTEPPSALEVTNPASPTRRPGNDKVETDAHDMQHGIDDASAKDLPHSTAFVPSTPLTTKLSQHREPQTEV